MHTPSFKCSKVTCILRDLGIEPAVPHSGKWLPPTFPKMPKMHSKLNSRYLDVLAPASARTEELLFGRRTGMPLLAVVYLSLAFN